MIENRPGAGGNIGTDVVAKAAPDGHTLGLVVNTTLTVNPSLYKNMPFDADRDIAPVSIVGTGGQILIVHPSIPVRSVTEFVAFAKSAAAKKEPIAYASAGNGTASHLAMEYFRLHAGFEAIHVPYRSVAPMVVDLLAGQVKVAFVGTSVIVDHVQAGRLSGLGVSHVSRAPLVPDVPTIAESGYVGFKIETFSILLAPARIPEPIARILEREVQAALKLPDMAERFRLMDTVPVGTDRPGGPGTHRKSTGKFGRKSSRQPTYVSTEGALHRHRCNNLLATEQNHEMSERKTTGSGVTQVRRMSIERWRYTAALGQNAKNSH